MPVCFTAYDLLPSLVSPRQDMAGKARLRMRSSRGKTLTFDPLSPAVKDITDAEWTLMAFVELGEHGSGMSNRRTNQVVQ